MHLRTACRGRAESTSALGLLFHTAKVRRISNITAPTTHHYLCAHTYTQTRRGKMFELSPKAAACFRYYSGWSLLLSSFSFRFEETSTLLSKSILASLGPRAFFFRRRNSLYLRPNHDNHMEFWKLRRILQVTLFSRYRSVLGPILPKFFTATARNSGVCPKF